ncbi:MAG: adenylate/guanylate cyclase domain-containing protein [Alphaproteobacteria bacterium]|nr:adenylate/guanylate cyclase domain-containing protein [Alphaproteobacteria bacterium]MBO7641973.1 adenylate/guanylate cyclase domain-containing protein [Alphaproteobacteria bacterium]
MDKENDEKVAEEGTEAKTVSDKTEETTAKTKNNTTTRSTVGNQDINQNLKNVKLEDLEDDEGEESLQQDLSKSSDEIEEEITSLIATGHMFKAHMIAKKAFQKHPENVNIAQAYSLVLLKTGALEESRKLLYPILNVSPVLEEATGEEMITVESLLASPFLRTGRPDVIANIGHIFKESWKYSHHCRDLELAKELYLSSFKRDQKTSTGMNAAWLAWLTGDDEQAKQLAAAVLKLLPPYGLEANFSELIDLAEAQLLLGREEEACKLYEEAMKSKDKINYILIVAARQQLYFLREAGFKVPNAALDILVPPTIVVFTGHSIDHPSFQVSLFPPDIEEDVKRIIKEKLESINAKIGYSSASCGADILFIEALQELGGEVNIVLPFAIQDFIENNVRHAGPRWEKRFEKALANAHSVSFSCEDRYLGHDMLYRFSNHVMHGSAVMRGKFLTTDPHLMAVWHSRTDSLPGGPADFIDRWSNISTLHLIDLDELYNENGTTDQIDTNLIKPQKTSLSFDPFVSKSPERVIKSMMFSDLHGYSKLQDEHVPSFLDFLEKLNQAMEKINTELDSLNTWGDAIFAVADTATKIADFGLRYCDIIESLGKKYPEFPFPIRARISLHSGPVFVAQDPFIKKVNFYGGHINRAARLEPVTAVGQVYATQQFVSLLHGETSDERNEYVQKGLKYYERYSTEYVGVIALAKSFGQQEVYHLRWK